MHLPSKWKVFGGGRGQIPTIPIYSTGPASTSGIAIMPRRTMQGILSIVVQHYIQKMLARETKSIFSFRPFLSKISKIKKMKKYFLHHFCHILIYGEFIRRIYEKVFDISFFMNLNRVIHSLKNNWEVKTLIKTSVELKT